MARRSRSWREWPRYDPAHQDHWSGTGWLRSRVAMRATRSRSRTLRNASCPADAGTSDAGLRRVGVLEFAEVYFHQHCAVAAEGRDAPRGIVAAGTSGGVLRAGG